MHVQSFAPLTTISRVALACLGLCAPLTAFAGGDDVHVDGFERCLPQWPNGSVSEWNSAYSSPWPSFGSISRVAVTPDSFVSLRFTTSSAMGQSGTFQFATGTGVFSISRTPGCFDPSFLDAECVSELGGAQGISWNIGAAGPSCTLQPDTSYYLNINLGSSGGSRDLTSTP